MLGYIVGEASGVSDVDLCGRGGKCGNLLTVAYGYHIGAQ